MKGKFPGYYLPTDDEFDEIWENCEFVFDANVLLNLYRYSKETSQELIKILNAVSDRIWLPHQAALEYHRNRISVINTQRGSYKKIKEILDNSEEEIIKDLRNVCRPGRHPQIDNEDFFEKLKELFTSYKDELDKMREDHPDLTYDDPIRDEITTLFDDKVSDPFPPDRMEEVSRKGKDRYSREIPPGYKDEGKGNANQYGDLILWFQIIEHARSEKRAIIFITDDRKEDWWYRIVF